MNKRDIKKKNRYYFICSILTSIVFLAIGAYTIYAAIPSPGHGTSALEGNASLNMNSNKIINLTTPTAATDAATKAYVDAAGGKVAYRFIDAGNTACPTVAEVTCRAKTCAAYTSSQGWMRVYSCDSLSGCYEGGALCYYSSL